MCGILCFIFIVGGLYTGNFTLYMVAGLFGVAMEIHSYTERVFADGKDEPDDLYYDGGDEQ